MSSCFLKRSVIFQVLHFYGPAYILHTLQTPEICDCCVTFLCRFSTNTTLYSCACRCIYCSCLWHSHFKFSIRLNVGLSFTVSDNVLYHMLLFLIMTSLFVIELVFSCLCLYFWLSVSGLSIAWEDSTSPKSVAYTVVLCRVCRPETCIPDEQHVSGCRRIQVACSGYL